MDDLVFYIHLASLAIAAIGIVWADHQAWGWIRGTHDTILHSKLLATHWVVGSGLTGLIASGLYLFWPARDFLLGQPLFLLKMAFVAALVVNSFVIEHLMHAAVRGPWRALSTRERLPLVVSGAVSTISWFGAGIVALVLFGF